LSRGERLRRKRPRFLEKIFLGQARLPHQSLSGEELLNLSVTGGYPDVIKRRSERRRQDWHHAYIQSIVERDVPEIVDLAKPGQIPRVLEIAARFAGQLTNLSEIGRRVEIDHKAVDRYLHAPE
jgi:uncharacterized protein